MQYKKICISFECTVQQCIRKWCSTDAHFSLIPASPPTWFRHIWLNHAEAHSTDQSVILYTDLFIPLLNITDGAISKQTAEHPISKQVLGWKKKIPIFWPHLWYYTKLSCSAQLYNFIGTFKTLDQGKRWFKK